MSFRGHNNCCKLRWYRHITKQRSTVEPHLIELIHKTKWNKTEFFAGSGFIIVPRNCTRSTCHCANFRTWKNILNHWRKVDLSLCHLSAQGWLVMVLTFGLGRIFQIIGICHLSAQNQIVTVPVFRLEKYFELLAQSRLVIVTPTRTKLTCHSLCWFLDLE